MRAQYCEQYGAPNVTKIRARRYRGALPRNIATWMMIPQYYAVGVKTSSDCDPVILRGPNSTVFGDPVILRDPVYAEKRIRTTRVQSSIVVRFYWNSGSLSGPVKELRRKQALSKISRFGH